MFTPKTFKIRRTDSDRDSMMRMDHHRIRARIPKPMRNAARPVYGMKEADPSCWRLRIRFPKRASVSIWTSNRIKTGRRPTPPDRRGSPDPVALPIFAFRPSRFPVLISRFERGIRGETSGPSTTGSGDPRRSSKSTMTRVSRNEPDPRPRTRNFPKRTQWQSVTPKRPGTIPESNPILCPEREIFRNEPSGNL